jgi:hypothetical protein
MNGNLPWTPFSYRLFPGLFELPGALESPGAGVAASFKLLSNESKYVVASPSAGPRLASPTTLRVNVRPPIKACR